MSYFVVALVMIFVPKLKLTRSLEDEEELLRTDTDLSGPGTSPPLLLVYFFFLVDYGVDAE